MDTKKKIFLLYLALLAFHVAHVFEEVWGRFWLLDAVFGLGWYLVANWVLFCIPLALFYFILVGKHRAYVLGMVYAVIMILNGVGHNIATVVTGRYFDGFAGGFTGIGLVVIGVPLLVMLWKKVRSQTGT